MNKIITLFLFFVSCTAILPSRSSFLTNIDNEKLKGKYFIINDEEKQSNIELSDTICVLYFKAMDLVDLYEKKDNDKAIRDTLRPYISNCCEEYYWNPQENNKNIYNCKKWSKGIGIYRGTLSSIQVYNGDTLYCEVIDTGNGRIFSLLMKRN